MSHCMQQLDALKLERRWTSTSSAEHRAHPKRSSADARKGLGTSAVGVSRLVLSSSTSILTGVGGVREEVQRLLPTTSKNRNSDDNFPTIGR